MTNQVSALESSALPPLGGATLTVIGDNFGPTDSEMKVNIGRSACAASVWTSDSSLSCTLRPGLGGDLGILVNP